MARYSRKRVPGLRHVRGTFMEPYPFDDSRPPSVEELRYIAKKLRKPSDSTMFPRFLREQYADMADRQADSMERTIRFLDNPPVSKDGKTITLKIVKKP